MEKVFELIHSDIIMTTFSIKTGKLVKINGKVDYISAVRKNFGETSDLKMIVETTISEGKYVSISGFYKGTQWEMVKIKFPFKVRFAAIFEFENNLIIKHDKHLDTLELLRLSGNSVFGENAEDKIQEYLKLLGELGLTRS